MYFCESQLNIYIYFDDQSISIYNNGLYRLQLVLENIGNHKIFVAWVVSMTLLLKIFHWLGVSFKIWQTLLLLKLGDRNLLRKYFPLRIAVFEPSNMMAKCNPRHTKYR